MRKIFTVLCLFSIFLPSLPRHVLAQPPYAPLFDSSKASKHVAFKLREAKERLPSAQEVPVPAFGKAFLYSVAEISSTSDREYQVSNILSLASEAPKSEVLAFYQKALPSWKHETMKNGKEVFLQSGDQRWWGGSSLLEAPRLELVDLAGSSADPEKMGIEGSLLKESNPEMQTLIQVYYEKGREELLPINVQKLMASCIEQQVQEKQKLAKNDEGKVNQFILSMARSNCERSVQKNCEKEPKGRFCQRYARVYGSKQ